MTTRAILAVMCAAAAATVMLMGIPSPALAEKRVAMVVGIDTYPALGAGAQLQRAVSDADAVSSSLGKLGFSVTTLSGGGRVTHDMFVKRFSSFVQEIQPGDIAVFYFAGHGFMLGRENYLVPADMPDLTDIDEYIIRDHALTETGLRARIRVRYSAHCISPKGDPITLNVARTFLAVSCLIGCSQAVDAKALIRLSWRSIEIEEMPRSQTHISHSTESYILDGNTISNGGYEPIVQLDYEARGVNGNGRQYNIHYTVRNGSIAIVLQFPGSMTMESIATDGANSCLASIEYRPLPGKDRMFTQRISDHSPMVLSARYAD